MKIPQSRLCICGHAQTEHNRMSGCTGANTWGGESICYCKATDQEWWQQALSGTLTHRWVRGFWTREHPWKAREPFQQSLPTHPEVPSASDLDIIA